MYPKEINQTVELLKKLKPGLLPYPIFVQLARLTVLSTVEITAFVETRGKPLQVFLTKRSKDDEFWPNLWHIPGTILRPTDKTHSYETAINRLLKNEFGTSHFKHLPTYITHILRKENRGTAHSIMFWALLKKCPKKGELFNVDALPKNIVAETRENISLAKKSYQLWI